MTIPDPTKLARRALSSAAMPLLVVSSSAISHTVHADVIPYLMAPTRDAWYAAAGPDVISVDFEGVPPQVLSNQYQASHGISFSSPGSFSQQVGLVTSGPDSEETNYAMWFQQPFINPPNSGLIMSFATPQHSIGFDSIAWTGCFVPPSSAGAFTGLNIVFSMNNTVVGGWKQTTDLGITTTNYWETYLGFTSTVQFDKARVWWGSPIGGWADNSAQSFIGAVSFSTVPAPGALWCVIALCATKRLRRARLAGC